MQALFADLLRLRWSVASCAGLVLAGALLAWLARVQVQAVLREEAAVAGQRQEIQRKLSRATDEEQEIREKIARYLDITRRGLIGREERLAWVEEIARIKANRKLFDIEYEILPQKPVDPVLLPDGAAAGEGGNGSARRSSPPPRRGVSRRDSPRGRRRPASPPPRTCRRSTPRAAGAAAADRTA